MAEQREFLQIRTGGVVPKGISQGFLYFQQAAVLQFLFCQSMQVFHLSAELFIYHPFYNQNAESHSQNRGFYPVRAAQQCWLYHTPGLSVSCSQQDQVCLFPLVSQHPPPRTLQTLFQHPSVITPSSCCRLFCFSLVPSFLNTESLFSLKKTTKTHQNQL